LLILLLAEGQVGIIMNMSQTKSQSFIKGAAILALSGMLVKLIGVLYTIPLANIIGDFGNGVYQAAFPVYTILLTISTAGLPPAISKMVSERITRGDTASANKVFRVALYTMSLFGLIATVFVFFFRNPIATYLLSQQLAQIPLAYIAPALFFVCVLSAIRGYFQGLGNMKPTAVTQVIEQVIKVGLGIYFAYRWVSRGPEYGAAGAFFGIMISELAAMVSILFIYLVRCEKPVSLRPSHENSRSIARELASLSLPILLGASIMPIVSLTDSVLIIRLLESAGYNNETATTLLGMFARRVNNLINVPGTLSLGFCISMVPAVSGNAAKGDMAGVRRNIEMGFKMAVLVGIPSAVGLGVLASPIMDLMYGYRFTQEAIVLSGELLVILAGGVIFLSILQTLNGALQGLGRVYVPVTALGIGALVKIIANLILVSRPEINIYGAPIATFLCYFVAAIIDIVMVRRIAKVKFDFMNNIMRTLLGSALMGACAWGSYHLLVNHIGSKPATLIAVLLGILVFAACIPIFQIMTRREVAGLPGGRAFARFYDALSKKEGKKCL